MEHSRFDIGIEDKSSEQLKSDAFDLMRIFSSNDPHETPEAKLRNAWKILEQKSYSEIGAIAKEFKDCFLSEAAKRQNNSDRSAREEAHLHPNIAAIGKMLDEARTNMLPDHYQRLVKLIREKNISEIPETSKHNAGQFLSQGSDLQIGKSQIRTLPNGRQYEIYIPKTVNATNENGDLKIPTIVGLHGVLADHEVPGAMQKMAGLNLLADKLGFAVIYPRAESEKALMNLNLAGWKVKDSANIVSNRRSSDDTEFVRDVIDDVRRQVQITSKVGMIGHSDGGRMAQFYAMRHPEEVAAIVPITSTWMDGDKLPSETAPIPTRIIIGDKDNTLPLNGGRGWRSFFYSMMVSNNSNKSRPLDMIANWSKINGCESVSPEISRSGIVRSLDFKNWSAAPLRIDIVKGGGHPVPDWRNVDTMRKESINLNLSNDAVKWILPHVMQTRFSGS